MTKEQMITLRTYWTDLRMREHSLSLEISDFHRTIQENIREGIISREDYQTLDSDSWNDFQRMILPLTFPEDWMDMNREEEENTRNLTYEEFQGRINR